MCEEMWVDTLEKLETCFAEIIPWLSAALLLLDLERQPPVKPFWCAGTPLDVM